MPMSHRPRRPKVFGRGSARPMDRNAKARVIAYARAWSTRRRQPGQHGGPLTHAIMGVLGALLFVFHNSRDGRCFPSYERIAEEAACARSTVGRAIGALEAAGVLGVENRLVWQRVRRAGLFGPELVRLPRRTSNAYTFRDPHPSKRLDLPKSENQPGTAKQDSLCLKSPLPDPESPLERALASLGGQIGRKEAADGEGKEELPTAKRSPIG